MHKIEEKKRKDMILNLIRISDGVKKGRWVSMGHGFIPIDENGEEIPLESLPESEQKEMADISNRLTEIDRKRESIKLVE
jgi:hypothetical protein